MKLENPFPEHRCFFFIFFALRNENSRKNLADSKNCCTFASAFRGYWPEWAGKPAEMHSYRTN